MKIKTNVDRVPNISKTEMEHEKAIKDLARTSKILGMDLKAVMASVRATLQTAPHNIK